ncbi:MAG: DUF2695 domain-containing protein [Bacteroidetes bacterium]|jgi:hypothetical protein|nr:DUF2695 domain-containing protein [Bacteroidota bacterium]
MKPEIIIKDHEHFDKLMSRIAKNVDDNGCQHNFKNLRLSCSDLEDWQDIKVNFKETMEYMESRGGYCDCEILMNVPFADEPINS